MILVTGGTGFLGSELLKLLSVTGNKVRAAKMEASIIPKRLEANPNIQWVDADIRDYDALEKAMEGITHVYHCAAFVSFDPSRDNQMHETNVNGTTHIVNLCLKYKIKKLVHVSSVATLGDKDKKELITEDSDWVPGKLSGYHYTKYAGEKEVWRGISQGLNAVIVNPSVIIGKNIGTRGSGAIFETARRGLPFYTTGGCGFVDAEDVAKIMVWLMNSEIQSTRFILNAENCSYKDLFTQAAKQWGIRPPVIKIYPWMFMAAFRAQQLLCAITKKPSHLTKTAVKSSFTKYYYSNQKILNETNIQFKPLKQTIAEICTALKPN